METFPLLPSAPWTRGRLWSIRAKRALDALGLSGDATLADIARFDEDQILGLPNCGRTTMTEIRNVLARAGLHFGWTEPVNPPPPPFGLRDYFAAQGLTGILACGTMTHAPERAAENARAAYAMADAMLAERAKRGAS